jgi:hypothetical protein
VVVHVDAPVLAAPDQLGQLVLEGGRAFRGTRHVAAATPRRQACDASRVVMRHDGAGHLVGIGARARTIPPALRRALQHPDRGCRFPGCGVRFGQGITCATGPTAAPPRSRTSPSCAADTTAPCTRRAIRSIDSLMACSGSGGRMGERLPEVPPSAQVPADPVETLRAQHAAQGLHVHGRTGCATGLGE